MTEDAIEFSYIDVGSATSPRISNMFSSFRNRESEEKFAESLRVLSSAFPGLLPAAI